VPARRHTILVVDDTPLIRELGALFLARAGRVVTAASGEEALALADELQPDLIVADLLMPGMDGAVLCERLKQSPAHSQVPVVLLAATGEAAERERAVRAGANDVLPKPIERMALLDAARRYLNEPTPRALPRIEVTARAELRQRRHAWDATARNVSRGGVFVETPRILEAHSELELALALPEATGVIASTAQVVWTRARGRTREPGMGLRFLGLDRRTARALADYIEERLPHPRALQEE
jgi:uncharacterized protein (TIGR02266 family)